MNANRTKVLMGAFTRFWKELAARSESIFVKMSTIRHSRLGPFVPAAGIAVVAFALSGCLQVRSYVDPKLPRVSMAEIHHPEKPQPLRLSFEFQRNGKVNDRATKEVQPQVVRVLTDSRLFSPVSSDGSRDSARLEIVMNNVADVGDAASKGFLTGLTFGGAGSLVTDGYIFTATYVAPGKDAVTKRYEHALYTTIGNKKGPEGLEPKSVNEAIAEVVEQLMLNLLRDLQKDGAL